MLEGFPKNQEQAPTYEYFDNRHERHDIYEFCKELGRYLEKHKVPNIIFLDRSARLAWIGVDEYWNQHFKDTPKPHFYFVNPGGFRRTKNGLMVDPHEIGSFLSELMETGRPPIQKTEEDIIERFMTVYPDLTKDIDKPLVVFDTCAHTGKTLQPVLDILEKVGFEDIRTITANTPDYSSEIEPAAVIDTRTHLRSCYPFGEDSLVAKTKDVVSKPDPQGDQYLGNQARQEIRSIIRERN